MCICIEEFAFKFFFASYDVIIDIFKLHWKNFLITNEMWLAVRKLWEVQEGEENVARFIGAQAFMWASFAQVVNEYPAFYETWTFTAVFTGIRH
jgi:hypothetical protein